MNKNDRSVDVTLHTFRKKKKFWVFVTLGSFGKMTVLGNDRSDTFWSFDANAPMTKSDRGGQLSLAGV